MIDSRSGEPHQLTGEPETPARLKVFRAFDRLRRRLLADRVARRLVTLGGMLIIGSILSILAVIVAQVYPLFMPASATAGQAVTGSALPPLRLGVDEYRAVAYAVTEAGVEFRSLDSGAALLVTEPLDLGGARISSVSHGTGDRFALGLSDGRVMPVAILFQTDYVSENRVVTPSIKVGTASRVSPDGQAVGQIAYAETPSGPLLVTATGPRRIVLAVVEETTSLAGETSSEISEFSVDLEMQGEITAMAVDQRGDDLFLGTSHGAVLRVDLRDKAAPQLRGAAVQASADQTAAVSALQFLIGDRTLVVGSSSGELSTWQNLRAGEADYHLVRIHAFKPHAGRVLTIAPSRRDKGFMTLDNRGVIHLNYGTTGKTLLVIPAEPNTAALAYAPKADGFLASDARGTINTWSLKNRHPEITLRSLFGKLWYEGYEAPAYVWQSTGGSDDSEAKFSLTPLLYGTLKGTFFALLFAIPLALLSALYTSQFMHPNLHQRVKPVVEIMAALPSVVLGFIAGLWLAPHMEKVVPGILVMPPVIALCVLIACLLWRSTPGVVRRRIKSGYELILLVPVVLFSVWASIRLGAFLEQTFLLGDFRVWMRQALGLTFDQRNSMVVGFAMGFAVVPIIFTIAEDSLSSVPQHLKAASLALGATAWQTAVRVILPTASPGIFSGIMVGLGRAVGETMIVLMATGNTPVMNASIFSGFRAMSANIAVELPEAPDGGTLFRVLFVAALLLFLLTFVMNTIAELIRLRLRRKYRYL